MANTRTAPGVNLGFCNPYGAESGGPRRVLGGLHGPGSAVTPGIPGLPEHVVQGEWSCPERAQVRCRMVCGCGHSGQVMALCSWHDADTGHTEMVAGQARWIPDRIRVHGHFEEIQKRQAGSCPRCLFPVHGSTDYAQLQKAWTALTNDLAILHGMGQWRTPKAESLRQAITAMGDEFDLARQLGIIHNCPLTLVPVS